MWNIRVCHKNVFGRNSGKTYLRTFPPIFVQRFSWDTRALYDLLLFVHYVIIGTKTSSSTMYGILFNNVCK